MAVDLRHIHRDSTGGLVVKTSPSNAEGAGLILGRGVKIPHALQLNNNKNKKPLETEAVL